MIDNNEEDYSDEILINFLSGEVDDATSKRIKALWNDSNSKVSKWFNHFFWKAANFEKVGQLVMLEGVLEEAGIPMPVIVEGKVVSSRIIPTTNEEVRRIENSEEKND